ncbi:MAG: glycosyltransferase family 9 protein [Rhodospirillaceae bacterium]|nr:glycosyltransferase family 9 protein [Rhodospirillaceae bacterium]
MKILFITWTRIGDGVLSTGLLHELTRRHPGAEITVVCGPLAQTLFANVPGLKRIIALRKRPLNAHWFTLWRQVVGEKWDLVIDLRRSLTSYFIRAEDRRILGATDTTQHRVAWLPSLIDIQAPLDPYLWIDEAQHARATALLPDGAPVLAIAPIAARPEKTWSDENFARLVRQLLAPDGICAGWRVLLAAGPGEEKQFPALVAAVPPDRLTVMTDQPDLLVVAAALQRCRLYIGNDSGLTHLSAAAGVATMALFGPTNPSHFGPWGEQGRVVEAPAVNGARLMANLSVAAVAAAVAEMIHHTHAA